MGRRHIISNLTIVPTETCYIAGLRFYCYAKKDSGEFYLDTKCLYLFFVNMLNLLNIVIQFNQDEFSLLLA